MNTQEQAFPQDVLVAAAERLSQSEKGREALIGLKEFFERGVSLDAENIRACVTLIGGFFGGKTGSALDAVREAAAETG